MLHSRAFVYLNGLNKQYKYVKQILIIHPNIEEYQCTLKKAQILTCERRTHEIGDALDEQQKAVGVGEALKGDGLDEDDAGETVVGGDEEAEGTGDPAHEVVRPDRHRHEGDERTAHGHTDGVDHRGVDPRAVARPAQKDLWKLFNIARFNRILQGRSNGRCNLENEESTLDWSYAYRNGLM